MLEEEIMQKERYIKGMRDGLAELTLTGPPYSNARSAMVSSFKSDIFAAEVELTDLRNKKEIEDMERERSLIDTLQSRPDTSDEGFRWPNVRPVFAWYDIWLGAYWSRKEKTLYLMVPFIGIRIDFAPPNKEAT